MEAGPRALGNRSLLADPRDPEMREILNHKVKHREYFRPFAPSVLAERADEWFAIAKPTTAAEFMLVAYPAHEAVRDRIPAVVHADGTCRVQTVRQSVNPRYHELISEFVGPDGRADGAEHVVQRQRADRVHARRRRGHVPQDGDRRPGDRRPPREPGRPAGLTPVEGGVADGRGRGRA